MKTGLWIGLGILVVVGLVLAALAVGWALWGQRLWAAGPPPYGSAGQRAFSGDYYCGGWALGRGSGMMGRGAVGPEECPAWGSDAPEEEGSGPTSELTIEEAHEAIEEYLTARSYVGLEVAEVMEFERNFYAIVRESDTGIGAMELLVDKDSGIVGPEMGPNMMWNVRYGMHGGGRMMGSVSDANAIAPEEAMEIAQRWLDANLPGVTPDEHADRFYGYYTLHTLEAGNTEGMLSVHGTTGQVWYHNWHGSFIQMNEEGEVH